MVDKSKTNKLYLEFLCAQGKFKEKRNCSQDLNIHFKQKCLWKINKAEEKFLEEVTYRKVPGIYVGKAIWQEPDESLIAQIHFSFCLQSTVIGFSSLSCTGEGSHHMRSIISWGAAREPVPQHTRASSPVGGQRTCLSDHEKHQLQGEVREPVPCLLLLSPLKETLVPLK